VIRPSSIDGTRLQRRQLLRIGFAGVVTLIVLELAAAIAPFLRVTRITGLGAPVAVGTAADVARATPTVEDVFIERMGSGNFQLPTSNSQQQR